MTCPTLDIPSFSIDNGTHIFRHRLSHSVDYTHVVGGLCESQTEEGMSDDRMTKEENEGQSKVKIAPEIPSTSRCSA